MNASQLRAAVGFADATDGEVDWDQVHGSAVVYAALSSRLGELEFTDVVLVSQLYRDVEGLDRRVRRQDREPPPELYSAADREMERLERAAERHDRKGLLRFARSLESAAIALVIGYLSGCRAFMPLRWQKGKRSPELAEVIRRAAGPDRTTLQRRASEAAALGLGPAPESESRTPRLSS